MNLDQFSYEENGRRYINPQVALDEQNAFIDNLRQTQAQDNAKIYRDTHNLGTDVPSNIGGLNGGESYFNARYQTPQTNYNISNIRATAQAQALSDALTNEYNKAKKRYTDAYRAAAKRSNTTTDSDKKKADNIDYETDEGKDGADTYKYEGKVDSETGLKRDDEASKTWGTNINEGEVEEIQNPFQPIGDFFLWLGERGHDIRTHLPWNRGDN